ncbi:hypothetical protein KQY30_23740 [Streptomyces sp. GMY02]|nr:hypothetical protein [Streptomyces sp. GMY02]QXE36780.1 hypothetical protein KQY30_23740 [Streptomyces sp. GMY02]
MAMPSCGGPDPAHVRDGPYVRTIHTFLLDPLSRTDRDTLPRAVALFSE